MQTLNQLFEQYLSFKAISGVPSTIVSMREKLAPWLRVVGRLTPQEFNHDHAVRWIDQRRNVECLKNVTIQADLRAMQAFFRWMTFQWPPFVDKLPIVKEMLPQLICGKPRKVPFTDAQYRRLLAHIGTKERRSFWPMACMLAWSTGMRQIDIAHLRFDSLNFDDEIIKFRPIKMKRFDQELEVPMEPELYEELLRLTNGRGQFAVYVLPVMQTIYVEQRALLTVAFRRFCDQLGLKSHSFHSFRHGFVTKLVDAGVDLVTISSMTGQSIAQLADYSHVSNTAKAVALDKARKALHEVELQRMALQRRPRLEEAAQV